VRVIDVTRPYGASIGGHDDRRDVIGRIESRMNHPRDENHPRDPGFSDDPAPGRLLGWKAGTLIIAAWNEGPADAGFRARVMSTSDVSLTEPTVSLVADPNEVVDIVKSWLDEFQKR
jgi:hypothetical protein